MSKGRQTPNKSTEIKENLIAHTKRVQGIMNDCSHVPSIPVEYLEHSPDGKWIEVVLNLSDEVDDGAQELYRIFSNSKHSINGETNRMWWKRNIIWGFYHYIFTEDNRQVVMYLYTSVRTSILSVHLRFSKPLSQNCSITVQTVDCPVFPTRKEGYKAFVNVGYKSNC